MGDFHTISFLGGGTKHRRPTSTSAPLNGWDTQATEQTLPASAHTAQPRASYRLTASESPGKGPGRHSARVPQLILSAGSHRGQWGRSAKTRKHDRKTGKGDDSEVLPKSKGGGNMQRERTLSLQGRIRSLNATMPSLPMTTYGSLQWAGTDTGPSQAAWQWGLWSPGFITWPCHSLAAWHTPHTLHHLSGGHC